MHARFSEVQIKPGKVNEFVEIFHTGMVPPTRAQKGFKGVTVLADTGANKVVLISYWDTEADAKAVEQSTVAFHAQIEKVKPLLDGQNKIDFFEVAYRE
jgi:heme-degrading monooxygenase HmoA